ncbi:glucose-1-phosphate adenylyltransferase [Natronogracilivirga saccharolytica]|uniref:Glucose-1-phosphate adenylyltransferase n=1 Tax=Natronogracilivirga saccharolytica TaxID=2812953 RepID=A0A8J7RQB7_9BACT|nr:glucose-1-phosphate adenylyltransferase [Natronogracilivirga saccharolytica]MBP3193984.1 glucose-1-phosphate adenylyltransferase [Natronogracilivirga saccharolytica]
MENKFSHREKKPEVMTMILAGGRGSRLSKLTEWRVKPAVPFGGNYRIIDFVLSNCINSGLRHIGVLTQYKSQSLTRHLVNGWNFLNNGFDGFMETISAQMRNKDEWYEGTADSIYQNIDLIQKYSPENILILGGDHIYKLDYNRLLSFHAEKQADVTVGCIEVSIKDAKSFGVMTTNTDHKITGFEEKSANPVTIPGNRNRCLASMGIYVFKTKRLLELLLQDAFNDQSTHDFGRDIIPAALNTRNVFAWPFVDEVSGKPEYWRDIGSIDSYWQANMDLFDPTHCMDIFNPNWPIKSIPQDRPPTFLHGKNDHSNNINHSMISAGCIIAGCRSENSIISDGVKMQNSLIRNSIILPDAVIGSGCRIHNAIIDKNTVIPDGLVIGEDREQDSKCFHVSPGGIRLITCEMVQNYVNEKQASAPLKVLPSKRHYQLYPLHKDHYAS